MLNLIVMYPMPVKMLAPEKIPALPPDWAALAPGPRRDAVCRAARELGFDLAGVAPAVLPAPYRQRFAAWIARGGHAGLDYLARRPADTEPALARLPTARSTICLALAYGSPGRPAPVAPACGRLSRYACIADYHAVAEALLAALAHWLQALGARTLAYVDYGPLDERAYAETAGLGQIGQHGCLITRDFGSWVFLAEILTDLELAPSAPLSCRLCRDCGRCRDACPTGARQAGAGLDTARCLSYLTIEHRGPIPPELRPALGHRLFGCDRCQDVCPANRCAGEARLPALRERWQPAGSLPLAEILRLDSDAAFLARFGTTPLRRAGRLGLLRNACVVAGNSGCRDLLPELQALRERETDPLLREHADWAIARLQG